MRRAAPAWLILAILGTTLTGCLGDAPIQEPESRSQPDADTGAEPTYQATAAPDTATPEPDAPPLQPMRFPQEGASLTAWRNGTVGVRQASALARAPAAHEPIIVDVTDLVPTGIPAKVTGRLTYDTASSEFVKLDIRLEDAGRNLYALKEAGDFGRSTLQATLSRTDAEPVAFAVTYTLPDERTEVPYELEIHVHAAPYLIPEAVPVAVHMEDPTQPLQLETPTPGAPVDLRIWGPDDQFIGRVLANETPAQWALPPGAVAGEYVIVPVEAEEGLRIAAHAPGTLRALDTVTTAGEPHELDPVEGATWTFDAPRAPLGIGVIVGRPSPEQATAPRKDLQGTVHGPAGEALVFMEEREPVPLGLGETAWWTPVGADGLTAGTYTVHLEAQSANVPAREVLLHYVR